MIDKIILNELRGMLFRYRKALMEMRESNERSWQVLNEPEIEPEETAGKETLSQGLEPLDSRRHRQVQQIDHAIAKMDRGDFGLCEGCGMPISIKRLKTLPWARQCIRCAEQEKSLQDVETPVGMGRAEGEGLNDAEVREEIFNELKDDGRVEMEELAVDCKDGVVYLKGVLPSQNSREVLWEIVSDSLGYRNIVDKIDIDRQPWERRDRTPGNVPAEKPAKQVLMEGEEEDTDTFTSLQEGEPMQPPDRMKPENDR